MKQNYYLRLGALLAIAVLLSACHAGGKRSESHSLRYYADSLRTVGRADELSDKQQDSLAIPLYDSVFHLPLAYTTSAETPGGQTDGLTEAEATLLCRSALRSLMVSYNIVMDVEAGYRHLDRIDSLHHPAVEAHCRMALYIAKAQMLMPLQRHREALDYLNRAAAITTEGDDPTYELYWTSSMGITYMGVDTVDTHAMQAFARAQDIVRRTGATSILYPHAMARLATVYLQQGKYEQSIDLCKEILAMDPKQVPNSARWVVLDNLTRAYTLLGLWDEALHYCALGTDGAAALEVDNNFKGRGFLAQAAIYAERGDARSGTAPSGALPKVMADSMLLAVHRADSCFRRTADPYMNLWLRIERARFLSYVADSLSQSLRAFEVLTPEVPAHRLPFFNFYYGDACTRSGQWQRAVSLLENSVDGLMAINERPTAGRAARLLAECYQRLGQAGQLAEFFPRYQALADSVTADARLRQLAMANIGFATQQKEQQNRLLAADVDLSRSRLLVALAVGGMLLIGIVGIAIWYVLRRRVWTLRDQISRREKEAADTRLREQEGQLRQLISARQELNDRNRRLLAQLATIQAEHEGTCHLDAVMENLQTSLVTVEEEEHFRTAFTALYPSALNHLRSFCPGITRSEELFAMLVAMKLNTEEIARTLGIARKSVTKIRYRLRPKLNLPEDGDVDACLLQLVLGHRGPDSK